MQAVNALLALSVEMAALFGWGLIGWHFFDAVPARVAAALFGVGLFALIWGVFAAPKSAHRLHQPWLAPFKAAMFASGALAFWAAGHPWPGLALALAGAAQIALAVALGAL